MPVELSVDGRVAVVGRDDVTLLAALRDELGIRSVKDGCSPQGQCGCCTVLVDGVPRVACVTPLRRVAGRHITTVDGLPRERIEPLVERFVDAGASQCGFCTPGILVRLAALGDDPTPAKVEQALLAHVCRCTGWRTIVEAVTAPGARNGVRDLERAAARASLEGAHPQRVGPDVVLGRAGFADDLAPAGALVAVPDGAGGWAVAESVTDARAAAGKIQGRRSGLPLSWPLAVPEGEWDLRLRTTWVEPAYLEPDASFAAPDQLPADPRSNGGSFGGKHDSVVTAVAAQLAATHGRPVRVLLSREDTVRLGPKRPPMAAGLRADGSGVVRVVATAGIVELLELVAPQLRVEEVRVPGPPTSLAVRAAGWAEAMVLAEGARALREGRVSDPTSAGPRRGEAVVVTLDGARAEAEVTLDGGGWATGVALRVDGGEVLDEVVLRSYAVGAAHMALGWVLSEGLAVGADGLPDDLTMRSFGILRARETPPISVEVVSSGASARPVSDAAFAAVAAATWIGLGLPPAWPTARGARTGG